MTQTNWALLQAIRKRGLRHGYVAEQVGLTADGLSRLLHGRKEPTPQLKAGLANCLNVDENELFEEGGLPMAEA